MGTEHARPLTWSPDSRSLAVVANGEIKAVDIATGGIRTLGRAPDGAAPYGGAWSGEDILLGGPRLRRLSMRRWSCDRPVSSRSWSVPARSAVVLAGWPNVVRYSRTVTTPRDEACSWARSILQESLACCQRPASTTVSRVGTSSTSARAPCSRSGSTWITTAQWVIQSASDQGIESFGPLIGYAVNGDTVVWSSGPVIPPGRLTWVDRNGRKVDEIGEVHRYRQIALAPDGQRVVTEEVDPRLAGKQGNSSMFLIDLTRPIHARLTTGNDGESDPIWSPDSHEVAFHSEGGVFKRKIDQPGRTNLFAGFAAGVEDWTHDGRFVILWTQHAKRLRAAAWRRSKANPPDSVLFNGR